MRDEKDRARKMLAGKILMVDVEALEFSTSKLSPKEGITSSSPTLHSSLSPIYTIEAHATYDQPPLTRVTIFTFGQLTKVAHLHDSKVGVHSQNFEAIY